MTQWTREAVAQRFEEAACTAHQLPRGRVPGYYNLWPAIRHRAWESYAAEHKVYYFPPEPAAVERMLEAMRWVQWLPIPQRRLIWMRAEANDWRAICRHFQCARTTAWRRWSQALDLVAARLNGPASGAGALPEVSSPCGGARADEGI